MRCLACDVSLSDLEATRKDSHGDFLDLCNKCLPPELRFMATFNSEFVSDEETTSGEDNETQS